MQVMQDILNRIAEMEHRPPAQTHFHIIYFFIFVLAVAAVFSLVSIKYRDTFFPRIDSTPAVTINVQSPATVRQLPPIDE